MRHRHSIGHWIFKGVAFIVIGVLAAFLFGYLVMSLWNWLMPALFALKTISYWQAIGLLLLSWLFFGRFRGGHWHRHGRHWRHRLAERWMRMSPEERDKLIQELHGHWHPHEPPSSGNAR